eukprot:XP_001709553.1 Hypothetical protein GL50803_32107 [Giardia lamblia ATCC 50803]
MARQINHVPECATPMPAALTAVAGPQVVNDRGDTSIHTSALFTRRRAVLSQHDRNWVRIQARQTGEDIDLRRHRRSGSSRRNSLWLSDPEFMLRNLLTRTPRFFASLTRNGVATMKPTMMRPKITIVEMSPAPLLEKLESSLPQ